MDFTESGSGQFIMVPHYSSSKRISVLRVTTLQTGRSLLYDLFYESLFFELLAGNKIQLYDLLFRATGVSSTTHGNAR